MDESEATDYCYSDESEINQDLLPDVVPSEEMLERLSSLPLFQHWQFKESASAHQAFVYPATPRTMEDGQLVGGMFADSSCTLIFEMADGGILVFDFESATTFQLTDDCLLHLATQLTKHLTPYTAEHACQLTTTDSRHVLSHLRVTFPQSHISRREPGWQRK